ncbi:MAG: hypothetical protein JXD23_16025 [Spirochaetales bacterium]|nr:hypothetical protein [Spirochaetales bacterium]
MRFSLTILVLFAFLFTAAGLLWSQSDDDRVHLPDAPPPEARPADPDAPPPAAQPDEPGAANDAAPALAEDPADGEFEKNFFSLGAEGIAPLQFGNGLGFGFNAHLLFHRFSLGLDVQWVDRHYYDYVSGAWVGPTTWGNINATSQNWLFYHDVLVFNLRAAYHFPLGWIQPYAGLGVSLLAVIPNNDALDSYPGFKAYFDENAGNISNAVGVFVFGGVDFFPWMRHFSIGLEYLFRFDQLAYIPESFNLYGITFLLSCSHLFLNLRFWM